MACRLPKIHRQVISVVEEAKRLFYPGVAEINEAVLK